MLALPAAAAANEATPSPPPEVRAELPLARLQGSGRMRFLGLEVYEAALWTEGRPATGDDWSMQPLALEITYARTLDGRRIAERSLDEMRRQAEIAEPTASRWLAAMAAMFPDVGDGDRITGVLRPGEGARFYLNGRRLGEVRDATFARLFFGIWLSNRTSEPALRSALLGRAR